MSQLLNYLAILSSNNRCKFFSESRVYALAFNWSLRTSIGGIEGLVWWQILPHTTRLWLLQHQIYLVIVGLPPA